MARPDYNTTKNRHIVHKHTTKGFNTVDEIEGILRDKLEPGEIALNIGKDRPSLVFFAEHKDGSPHDSDTNFDQMIELRPNPYEIHSATTDNVKPEIKEDHELLNPYYIENFVTKLSDEYEPKNEYIDLQPGTTLDDAIGQLEYRNDLINDRIDAIEDEEFATINGSTVRSTTSFMVGKIDGTPIVTKDAPANNFTFAKINNSAVTSYEDITIPMTTVSAGDGIGRL